MSTTSAVVLKLQAPCDRCSEQTFIGDLDWLDDAEGRWCIDCRVERANRDYWREPELNPDR